MAKRFPVLGARKRTQWTIYNLFMKKGAATDRYWRERARAWSRDGSADVLIGSLSLSSRNVILTVP